ncbi:MAG: heparan-alpha-glucosaminide N-acetyltransferase domain-containing protein [Sandaracinaceae bacterium]
MSRAIELGPLSPGYNDVNAHDVGDVVRPTAPPEPVAKAAERWVGLDLFRFCAVLLMVQGHVFTTLLDAASKSERWYAYHRFLHGYTAPMFLFGAGLAFGYTTFRQWDAHVAFGKPAQKRFGRYGWLLAIGYGLHLPTLSLSRLLHISDPEQIGRMMQVDVLQHIGVSLGICQLLVLVLRRQRVFIAAIAFLAAVLIVGAPWIWNLDVGGLPRWLAGYVNATTGSLFPLAPWAGFTYVGILVAYAVGLRPPETTRDGERPKSVSERAAWPFLCLSLLSMIVPVLVDRFGRLPLPDHNFWKTDPLFFFWRLGNVMFVLALLCFVERALESGAARGFVDRSASFARRAAQRVAMGLARVTRPFLPWVKIVGAETLAIYVAHLLILYGSAIGPGLKHTSMFGEGTQGVVVAGLVTAVFLVAMTLLAKGVHELRKTPVGFRAVQLTLVGFIVVFALIT